MKFLSFSNNGVKGIAVKSGADFRGFLEVDTEYPGDLLSLIRRGDNELTNAGQTLLAGEIVDLEEIEYLPPVSNPEKIICVGLNYRDHTKESGYEQPKFPTLFGRFNSSLIGHKAPIVRPSCSEQLDFEGELAVIIGQEARDVGLDQALDCISGYSIFNDASIRDYQFKSPQWLPGKNFDETGSFGPYFVTSDELPRGCAGLKLETRLNGKQVQIASIDEMVFSAAEIISVCSEFMTLKPGDVIVTGTPSGIGYARNPKLFMRNGDTCEVEIEGLGVLSNPIRDEIATQDE